MADNTPTLLGDRVAKRELEVRLAKVEEECNSLYCRVYNLAWLNYG